MSSRMVKWLILASVLLIAFPVVAGASTSRVAGLGIQGDYIKDYTNVFTYGSCVPNVGNLVYGELGNWNSDSRTDDEAVGAILGNLWDGKYGTFGIHLRSEIRQLGQGDANTPIDADGAWDPNENTSHSFDIMWGKKFGAMSLGLGLNRAYARLEGDPTIWDGEFGAYNDIKGDYRNTSGPLGLNYNRNVLGFSGGLGYEMSPKLTLEGSILYQSRTFEAKDTLGTKYSNDGSGAYLIAVRGLWQWQPNVLVVPVVRVYSITSKVKYEDPTAETPLTAAEKSPIDDSNSGWQAGLAGNWTLNQNDLFVLGATLGSSTYKYKGDNDGLYDYKYDDTFMPLVFAALETHLNSWLTLRFGAQQGVFYTEKYTNNITKNVTKDHYSWFDMMMGASVKLGTLQLDATLNPDFVHNGPYLISGENTSGMFPKVTATYTF